MGGRFGPTETSLLRSANTLSGAPALLPSHLHITVVLLVWCFIVVQYDLMVLVWCRWPFLFRPMLCYCILWVILLAQSHKFFRVSAMLLVVFLCHRSQSKVDCFIFLWYFIFQFRLVSLALVVELTMQWLVDAG